MSDTDYPTPITSSSSPPTTATAKITNANIARHSVSYNGKLLLKDNHIHKKCSKCQQLGSFICEHSTKYRDELKQMHTETGKFYQTPNSNFGSFRKSFNNKKKEK